MVNHNKATLLQQQTCYKSTMYHNIITAELQKKGPSLLLGLVASFYWYIWRLYFWLPLW